MPIYEYECRDCGQRFEYLLRGDEKPVCPACGGTKLDKQMSAPAAPQMSPNSNRCCGARGEKPCDAGGTCGGCPCTTGH
ncbi:MAG: zinc ribbon domain-containing protein [Pirellulales bacterium]|nr:zinc ribbon domain-containing protein [Pirellulales bacterium]